MGMLIHRHLEEMGKGAVKSAPEPKEVKVEKEETKKSESKKRK